MYTTMKKNLIILLVVFSCCFSVFSQPVGGDSWAAVQKKGYGKLAILYYEQTGLVYKAADGQIKGVCMDIIADFQKFIETKYGKKVTIEIIGEQNDFPKFLSTIQQTHNL